MTKPDMNLPPFRFPNYVEPKLDIEHRADGSIVMRNPHPLRGVPENLIAPIRKWAAEAPDRVWLGKRRPSKEGFGEWELLTYADTNRQVNAIAQALLDRGLDQSSPVMILSGNSIEHALMTYGAILAGVPVAPVSPSYSTMSSDFDKLRYVFDLVEPKLIFMQEAAPFERGLAALDLDGVELVTVDGSRGTAFADLLATAPGNAVEESYARQNYDMVAKYLFTSGSTGMPKAVITTQRMMCVNSVMPKSVTLEEENEEPAVLLNWLPWNHCFGGNAILNNLLVSGGTLYIDGGRPVPGGFAETVQNLREIAPTAYSNVPAAYTMLVDELENDEALAKNFFSRIRTMAYGGAALSQDLYDRIQKVAIRTVGERIVFSSGYGATETAPTICNVHWPTERMGLLGLPLPGIELKLAPVGQKMEVRVRGDCITKGYHKNPEKTREAYDEEGFYRLGDGARFLDPENPLEGLVFDGRVAEDFKLSTGTWVSAGKLRVDVVAGSNGVLSDALVAGLDRAFVGILGFPNIPACRNIAGDPSLAVEDLIRHPAVLERLADGMREHNKTHPGSSTRIVRALLMAEPPSVDAGELTDKGYINQSVALGRRAALVEKLYANPPGNDVVVV
ncbi:AMP-binding protein [Parvibaculum sp.]|uniref:AMP-binding protein n=1 Tax=Parvibaculum sp. TaxID=2024848 RepID=UPI002730F707|nr:AMP-binding protein [Parvibaculum sp.]MDP1626813.1 AMP-binding protein [Parvibaculum sp.]MDP2148459.1 AMP-binding protein [Parvibaculum sp.]MDP3329724.1 AMP-binding protein [Parvibaculum sp.]